MLNPNSECLCNLCQYMLIHPVFHVGIYSWLNTFETKPCHFERSNSLSNASKSGSNFQIDPNVNVYHLSKAYPLSISGVDIPENHHFSKENHINNKSSNFSKAKPFLLAAGRSMAPWHQDQHCRLHRMGNDFYVMALESQIGTLVDG